MDLEALRLVFRKMVDDAAQHSTLWSDEDINLFINAAEQEACLRARLLPVRPGAAGFVVTGVANTTEYAIHSKLFYVKSVRARGEADPMLPITLDEAERAAARNALSAATPRRYALQGAAIGAKSIVFDRPPTVGGLIDISGYRLPLQDMEADSDEPEIDPALHVKMLDWACYMAYSRRDADGQSEALAAKHAARMRQAFGDEIDWNVLRKQFTKVADSTGSAFQLF